MMPVNFIQPTVIAAARVTLIVWEYYLYYKTKQLS
jgi:hypothetical protein